MLVLGLTGKTGAGKSMVCSLLKEKGCYIIDADKVAREILEVGSPVIEKLKETFGEDVVKYNGEVDRKILAKKAFSSREETEKLNAITHPVIREKIADEIETAKIEEYTVCIVDAAALLESSVRLDCGKIAVVFAPNDVRLKRIIERDNLSVSDAKRRMDAQMPDEFYLERADIIIINDNVTDFDSEFEKLMKFIEINK
ncbi:MAG: dephospho-CoA kinase [Ruminococcaceae bacterium]|nr:dephospho-CoA kinase [Oscillospiraceae bacterium]